MTNSVWELYSKMANIMPLCELGVSWLRPAIHLSEAI